MCVDLKSQILRLYRKECIKNKKKATINLNIFMCANMLSRKEEKEKN